MASPLTDSPLPDNTHIGPLPPAPRQPWNLGVVDQAKNILRGAAPANPKATHPEQTLQWLAEHNIRRVLILNKSEQGIDLEAEVRCIEALGLKQQQADWEGLLQEAQAGHSAQWNRITALLERGNVYVHCVWGVDRTGAVIARARQELYGWSTRDAFRELRAYGFAFETEARDLLPYQLEVLSFFGMHLRDYEPLRPGHPHYESCPVRVQTAIG